MESHCGDAFSGGSEQKNGTLPDLVNEVILEQTVGAKNFPILKIQNTSVQTVRPFDGRREL